MHHSEIIQIIQVVDQVQVVKVNQTMEIMDFKQTTISKIVLTPVLLRASKQTTTKDKAIQLKIINILGVNIHNITIINMLELK